MLRAVRRRTTASGATESQVFESETKPETPVMCSVLESRIVFGASPSGSAPARLLPCAPAHHTRDRPTRPVPFGPDALATKHSQPGLRCSPSAARYPTCGRLQHSSFHGSLTSILDTLIPPPQYGYTGFRLGWDGLRPRTATRSSPSQNWKFATCVVRGSNVLGRKRISLPLPRGHHEWMSPPSNLPCPEDSQAVFVTFYTLIQEQLHGS